jgi:hypothetical protein
MRFGEQDVIRQNFVESMIFLYQLVNVLRHITIPPIPPRALPKSHIGKTPSANRAANVSKCTVVDGTFLNI